jgi:hypothetical protein
MDRDELITAVSGEDAPLGRAIRSSVAFDAICWDENEQPVDPRAFPILLIGLLLSSTVRADS